MKKFFILAIVLFTGWQLSFSQNSDDPVLLVVDDKDTVRASEFEAIYKKNNNADELDIEAMEEYLELYINFKLKVREAEKIGLDTLQSFKKELEGYKKQLQEPYLKDKSVTKKLMKEGYERMKTDIRASHILVKLPPDALPEDTLKAYNRIKKIRKRIVEDGEDFGELAQEVSEDPSAVQNKGDLGYFTAFYMVYPFENAAYATPEGEVSEPVRTKFGYHLVKVTGKRPARGEMKAAHIMVRIPKDAGEEDVEKTREKIMEIYQKLEEGEKFEEMAKKYSEDKTSAVKGGALPWFGTGRMVSEFENAAFSIEEDGEYTEPVRTDYGWHIVKRLDKRELPPFEEIEKKIKAKVKNDSRSDKSKEVFINRLKKEYGFEENEKAKNSFYKLIDKEKFVRGKWEAGNIAKAKKSLFSIGDENFTREDFALFLEDNAPRQPLNDIRVFINNKYQDFVEKSIIEYERERLAEKYPEYRFLLQEYRDGILLFDLTDRKVWSKSVKDSAGLEDFYQKNKEKFMWDERADVVVYYAKEKEIASKARKMVKKAERKGWNPEDIKNELNDDSQLNLTVEKGKYAKGENSVLDMFDWKEGISKPKEKNNQFVFVHIKEILEPRPKTLKEARGLVTSAYQEYLEKKWMEELKEKYEVKVFKDALEAIE